MSTVSELLYTIVLINKMKHSFRAQKECSSNLEWCYHALLKYINCTNTLNNKTLASNHWEGFQATTMDAGENGKGK